MEFDPTNVDAIKKLARDNCQEMIDADFHGKKIEPGRLGVEKYLSNEYLDTLDVETRETFLSVYDTESKLYYQELSNKGPGLYSKEFAEIHANLDKVEASINFQKKINAASKHLFWLIPLLAAVLTLIDHW